MPNESKNGDLSRPRPSNPTAIPNTPYLLSVLDLYCRLPHTPDRPRRDDRFVVRRLELQQQPLQRVRAALLLGTARRLFRGDDADPLMPIRSIRFFMPIVDELRVTGFDPGYVDYLARKLAAVTGTDLTLHDDTNLATPLKRRTSRQLVLPW